MTVASITSLLLAGLSDMLAILGIVWLIIPIQTTCPICYQESILDIDGLGVLPILLVPLFLALTGSVALYTWMATHSAKAKRVAWIVAIGFFVACLITMSIGPFFLPAALSLLLALIVHGISSRSKRRFTTD